MNEEIDAGMNVSVNDQGSSSLEKIGKAAGDAGSQIQSADESIVKFEKDSSLLSKTLSSISGVVDSLRKNIVAMNASINMDKIDPYRYTTPTVNSTNYGKSGHGNTSFMKDTPTQQMFTNNGNLRSTFRFDKQNAQLISGGAFDDSTLRSYAKIAQEQINSLYEKLIKTSGQKLLGYTPDIKAVNFTSEWKKQYEEQSRNRSSNEASIMRRMESDYGNFTNRDSWSEKTERFGGTRRYYGSDLSPAIYTGSSTQDSTIQEVYKEYIASLRAASESHDEEAKTTKDGTKSANHEFKYYKFEDPENLKNQAEREKRLREQFEWKKNGGNDYNNYTGGFSGGLAAALFNQGSRYSYRGGMTGMLARLGTKWASGDNWFGNLFGKLSSTSSKGNINNWLGGMLSNGTKNGLGINAGGLVLGGLAVAASTAASAVYKFGKECVDAYGSIQKLQVGLDVVYGSKTESAQSFEGIKNYAIKSPYGVTQTTEMAVLLKQSGVYSSDLLSTLRMIGDVSSGNEEKMKRIANNYAQIQAIGKASMLDMRQFAYAGIPIYKQVADYMKVSQTELRKMISEGKVTSDVIENVFKKMTSGGGIFNGAVEKQSMTYSARKQNLEDIKNIEKANIGESLYNLGSSQYAGNGLGANWMSFKEEWHKGISDYFEGKNITKDYESAKGTTTLNDLVESIAGSTASIDKKTKDNGDGKNSVFELPDSVKNILGLNDNISNQRAAYYRKAEDVLGLSGKSVITQKQSDELNKFIDDTIKSRKNLALSEVVDSYGNGDEERQNINSWYKDFSENVKDRVVFEDGTLSATAYDQAMLGVSDGNYELLKILGEIVESLQNTYTEQQKYNTLLEWRKSSDKDKVNYAQSEFETMAKDSLTKSMEDMNKFHDNANSVSSRTNMYNSLYAQTEAGKKEQADKDAADLKKYKEDYSTYSKMFKVTDKSTGMGVLDYANFTESKLIDCISSGILNAESQISLLPEDIRIKSYDTVAARDQKRADMNQFGANLDNILVGLDKRIYSATNKTEAAARNPKETPQYQAIKNLSDLVKSEYVYSEEGAKKVAVEWDKVMSITANTPLYKLLGTTTIKSSIDSESKYNGPDGNGSGKTFYALWKRIIASATGMDAEHMTGAMPAQVLTAYQRMQMRNISSGGINGMVDAGMNNAQIMDNLVFNGKKDTLRDTNFKVTQIDWAATQKSIIDGALSIKNGLEKSASILDGVNTEMQSQLEVYSKIQKMMFSQGEDFANITSTGIDSIDTAMQNAFGASSTGSATATWTTKSGRKVSQNAHYDKDKGWLIDSGVYSQGEYAGMSVEEINRTDKDRSGKPITIKVDNSTMTYTIQPLLDALNTNIKVAAEQVSVSNTLQQKALSLTKSTSETKIGSFLSNGDMFAKLMGYQNTYSLGNTGAGNADVLSMFNSFNETMKPILTDLSSLDWSGTSIEGVNEILEKSGLAKVDEEGFDIIKKMSESLKSEGFYSDSFRKIYTDFFNTPSMQAYLSALKDNTTALREASEEDAFRKLNAMNPSDFNLTKNGNSYIDQKKVDQLGSLTGSDTSGMSWKNTIERMVSEFENGNSFAGIQSKDFYSSYNQYLVDSSKGYSKKTMADLLSQTEEQKAAMNMLGSNDFFGSVTRALNGGGNILDKGSTGFNVGESLSSMGFGKEYQDLVANSGDLDKQKEIWDSIIDSINSASSSMTVFADKTLTSSMATLDLFKNISEIGKSLKSMIESSATSAFTSSMSLLGESLISGADASETLRTNFQKIGQSLFAQMGQMFVSAGLQMIIANPNNWAVGLALMAAGGVSSFLSGMMADSSSTDEAEKLKQIKEDMADLLKQARDDAVYYENTLRHKTALTVDEDVSSRNSTKVNDAIIKPNGTIYTNPDDYLYASTDPKNFVGGGSTPNVTFSIINNGQPVAVESRKQNNTDDGIDIKLVIKNVVAEGLASGEFNDAMSVNNSNIKGWGSVM